MTEKNWLAGESAWRKRLPHENVNPCSPMWGRRFRLPNGASSSRWVGQQAHGHSLPVAARLHPRKAPYLCRAPDLTGILIARNRKGWLSSYWVKSPTQLRTESQGDGMHY